MKNEDVARELVRIAKKLIVMPINEEKIAKRLVARSAEIQTGLIQKIEEDIEDEFGGDMNIGNIFLEVEEKGGKLWVEIEIDGYDLGSDDVWGEASYSVSPNYTTMLRGWWAQNKRKVLQNLRRDLGIS
jgi:hypothetical protein